MTINESHMCVCAYVSDALSIIIMPGPCMCVCVCVCVRTQIYAHEVVRSQPKCHPSNSDCSPSSTKHPRRQQRRHHRHRQRRRQVHRHSRPPPPRRERQHSSRHRMWTVRARFTPWTTVSCFVFLLSIRCSSPLPLSDGAHTYSFAHYIYVFPLWGEKPGKEEKLTIRIFLFGLLRMNKCVCECVRVIANDTDIGRLWVGTDALMKAHTELDAAKQAKRDVG